MFTRLTSRRFPSLVMETENGWSISADMSSVLIQANKQEDGSLDVKPIRAKKHALLVYRNPVLGLAPVQIITENDGLVDLVQPSKKSILGAGELDWHYKIFIVRVSFPDPN